jgi:hypothetical protein
MLQFNHYRAALYLCAAIAIIQAAWICFFIIPRMPQYEKGFIIPLMVTTMTVVGLLIHSNLIRYVGGVLIAIWAGALLWPLISDGTAPLFRPNGTAIFLDYAFTSALSLLTAAIMLFSKQFAYEFAKRRDSEPKYMRSLRRLLIGAVIVAALIATFNDIVQLANSP